MNQEQFAALMPYIITDLAALIVEKQHITEKQAVKKLYNSQLYALLEQEDTKVWYYSTPMLYSLLEQEEQSGKITFPDV